MSVLNAGAADQEADLILDLFQQRRSAPASARELITDTTIPIRHGSLRIALPAGSVRLLELREAPQK